MTAKSVTRYVRLFVLIICTVGISLPAVSQTTQTTSPTTNVLALLDLSKCGIDPALAESNSSAALAQLLEYFRHRKMKPVHEITGEGPAGAIPGTVQKHADDALRHVFVGQSSYPSHFVGEDINWSYNPVPDKEWIVQLHRMTFWTDMAQVYRDKHDEKYARAWVEQFFDWVRKNPKDEEHWYAWRSIEMGIRGYNFAILFESFLDSPAFTPEFLNVFLLSVHQHASELIKVYRSGSNWSLMEAEGLGTLGMIFPEFREAPEWRNEAFHRFGIEIHKQVRSDGYHVEQTISYHNGSMRWFWRPLQIAKALGYADAFPKNYEKVIESMAGAIMAMTLPDGTTPMFGDSAMVSKGNNFSILRKWGEAFSRADFTWIGTGGKLGTQPEHTAIALPVSGFYSMRSGWGPDDTCLALKCGPDGGGHCQPDNLTFELFANGRNLTPDSSCYIYSGDKYWRNWFRQTAVHQTATLNGENSLFSPRLVTWKPGEKNDVLVVENAGYPGFLHRRSVTFVDKKYFVLVDDIMGTATGEIDLHFQLAPGNWEFSPDKLSARTASTTESNVLICSTCTLPVKLMPEEGWVSFVYSHKQPRPAFTLKAHKSNDTPVRYVTALVPFVREVPKAEIQLKGNSPQVLLEGSAPFSIATLPEFEPSTPGKGRHSE